MNRTWVKILLAVSLVVNLFVVGAVAGVLVIRSRAQAQGDGDPLLHAADALPAGRRVAYRPMLAATIGALRPDRRDARMARRQAITRFQAEPFDRAAVTRRLRAGPGRRRLRRGPKVEEAILDFAAKLPPDQRAAFARGLTRAAVARWVASHPGRTPPARAALTCERSIGAAQENAGASLGEPGVGCR